MNKKRLSRRRFLRNATGIAAGAVGFPYVVRSSALGNAGAGAGLDIHAQKPFARTIREGRAMCEAVERYGIVWQTGSQQRSEGNFHRACELVRNGRVGKIERVEVGLPTGEGTGNNPVQPV